MTSVQVVDERGFMLMEEEIQQTREWLECTLRDDGFKVTHKSVEALELAKVVGFSVLTIRIKEGDSDECPV